jgi:ubiquinone/menaquinone biosynthesis C-methylase UbiE
MGELDFRIRAYYERGNEANRLSGGFPSGPLELERTKEIIARYLPPPPLRIIDVGGGPGVYAAWLAARGDQVQVIDPVPLHVDQARSAHPGVSAEIGDARQLPGADASADAVLLLGPLYHLVDKADRLKALSESRRVLRPGGWAFVAAISRYAALLDLLIRAQRLHEPEIFRIVCDAIATGIFAGQVSQLFTTAYFHLPEELSREVQEAGFELNALLNIEGPGFLLQNFESNWADPPRRKVILDTARLLESKPELLAASAHILAVARKE